MQVGKKQKKEQNTKHKGHLYNTQTSDLRRANILHRIELHVRIAKHYTHSFSSRQKPKNHKTQRTFT